MWSGLCLSLVILSSVTNCQDADLDYSEKDYSTKLQQFLLQKLQEAETWAVEEELENLSDGKRGRQDLSDDEELPEIIDEDITDDDASNEEEGVEEADEEVVEETVEEAGEEESSEVIVLNTAPFLMSSLVSELSADIVLQEVTGSDRLTMTCKVSITGESEMFSDPSCLPQIYLVAGQTDCNSLTQEFSAKKLASVHGPGEGKTTVDATWSELPGKCLVVLRETECEETAEDVEEEEEEEEEEEIIVDTRRQTRVGNILTPAGLGRSYSTFSLTSFSVLSSGSSSLFTVTKPSVTYSGPLPGTIIATKYDRLSTLPYLQLAGWSQREAIFIVLFMVAMYFGYAYISANLVSIEPMRQKFFNEAQLNRFDAINDGMSVLANTYLTSLSSPWRKIAENIDDHLLKKPSSSQNKFMKKYGKSTSQRSDFSIDRMR